MNIPAIISAVSSAFKASAIVFLIIFALGIFTGFISAFLALLLTLIPLLETVTKVIIYSYPLFVTGVFVLNLSEELQTKETPTTKLITSAKQKRTKEIETIENGVIITPPSDEDLLLSNFYNSTKPETLEQLESPELHRQIESLNNQLALDAICWQALATTAKLLDGIKASEMKSMAAELQIPKYRNMNKTQLLLEIIRADDEAPVFSE